MAAFEQITQGDTANLLVYLSINNIQVTADQIESVQFTVQMPDLSLTSVAGTIQADGSAFYLWTETSEIGEYIVQAQFTLYSGEIRSVTYTFVVVDPFNPIAPNETDMVIDQVSLRLEDLFDSTTGGPWLKDQSMAHFDFTKVADFIPEALFDINKEMPPTNYTLDTFCMPVSQVLSDGEVFTMNPNMPLLVKGVLVLTIRHLMRSYTEQPIPQGGQVVWHDRTRYQQMWKAIYDVEYADYIAAVRLAKRTELGLGHAASLVFSKQGRLYPYGSQRSRGVWRGYN